MEIQIYFTNCECISIPKVDKFSIDGGNLKIHRTFETEVRYGSSNMVFALDKIAGYEIIQSEYKEVEHA